MIINMTTGVINNSILLIQIGEGRGINGRKSNFTLYISGELIKMKREDMEISLSELGRLSGVHKSALARIENGETKQPK
ncbi:helix-turn-helix domain-containing protein [Brevibacillus laterosporus]